jgi:uncharacterized protein
LRPQSCSFIASFDNAHAETHCIATEFKALPRLTKTAAVFGPNASGKTNLLIALRTMRDLVLNGSSSSTAQFAAAYTPFSLAESERQPVEFGVELLIDGVRYQYGFAYDAGGVTAESMHVHRGRKTQRWFERRQNAAGSDSWTRVAPGLSGPRDAWRRTAHPRALFLTSAARQGAEHAREIFRWFERDLAIVLSSDAADPSAFAARVRDPKFKAQALGILHAVDIQIDDVRAMNVVEFLHRREGRPSVWLDFAHEASGIQRLVHILGPLLDAIESGTFIAIDEVDSSLHPMVARFLIQLINDPLVSRRRAQLMINSHNTRLMDLDLLRRDEIWLMELTADHASRVSALLAQSPRKNERVAKNYLHGYFGAVPVIRPDKWRNAALPRSAAS